MNNSEWLEAVRLYKAYWPAATLSDASIAAWGNQLRNLQGGTVQQAIYDLAANNRWPPTLAELRSRCRDIARTAALAKGISTGSAAPDDAALVAEISDRYRRCSCGAALLPGFDPTGGQCRNCAPKSRVVDIRAKLEGSRR